MHTQVRIIDKNHSSHENQKKLAEFREYIQLEHHFSHNVQVLKTKMVDFKMIFTQKKIYGLVTI